MFKITKGNFKNKILFILIFTLAFNILGMGNTASKASAASLPKITGVKIADKTPKLGIYPTLQLTSTGSPSVQYSVYLYSKTKKTWENVSEGYTSAVKGNGTYSLKLKKPLQEGENSYSVWVKKAGTTPTNKGGYDHFQNYKVTVNSGTTQTIPTIKSVDIDQSEQKIGVLPKLKIVSNGDGKVQYRVFFYSNDKKVWEDVTDGYTSAVNAESVTSLKLTKPLQSGENSYSIWIKRSGQVPVNKEGYDNFLSYKVHIGSTDKPTPPVPPVSNVIPKITSVNIDASESKVGSFPTITLQSSGDTSVQYSVYLYSQCKGIWEDVSGGYTSSVDPEKPFSIKIKKPLQSGRNNFSIWVKREGMSPSDSGGYDSFVSEAVNVDVDPKASAKILSVTPSTDKITVGALPSVIVQGSTVDGSDISYKAFLYSNSQRKWIDASSFASAKSNAESTINLSTPLETGTNKLLVWAKKSSLTGEVHEDYQIVEIDAIRPKPMKQRIVVDPGHGGKDTGAINYATGSREKIIALSVSLKLGDILESNGYEILYTRTDNDNVAWDSSNKNESLNYRYTFANTNGADLFVSIHCNSFNGSDTGLGTASGTEVLYSKLYPNKDKALATTILDEYLKTTGMKSRGIKNNGNWQVVNHTKMPASLVELGFLDNQSDELKLKDPAFQQKAAQGVANGIMKYLTK